MSYSEWPHAPSHLFLPNAAYMVTAGTYGKQRIFDNGPKLDYLLGLLFQEAERFQWMLQAWAVMENHYHFVALAPRNGQTLSSFIRSMHSKSARWVNRRDGTPGRKVWFQYWDTCLTYERSYLARLKYVHYNPVKHHIVRRAEDYRWCSMHWFLHNAKESLRKRISSFKTDKINVEDNF